LHRTMNVCIFFYLEPWMCAFLSCSIRTIFVLQSCETVCRSYTRCNMISGSQLRRASFINHKLCSKWREGRGRANRVSIYWCIHRQEQELRCLGRHGCCPEWPGLVSLVKA
jgi:hypothetical protein